MSEEHPNRKPNDRLRRAKSEITHSRTSTETLRTEFRARFLNRLRNTRSKSVDRLRQIVEEYGDIVEYRSLSDIRKVLLQDREASNLLKTEEVNELLMLIERELEQVNLNKEGEEYIESSERETEDMLNRLLNVCQICGKLSDRVNICANCASEFSTDFK